MLSGSQQSRVVDPGICCLRRCCRHTRPAARRGSEGAAADASLAAPPTAPPVRCVVASDVSTAHVEHIGSLEGFPELTPSCVSQDRGQRR